MTFSKKEFITVLDWILFIGLTIASGGFAYGVFEQFFSKRSSFSQHEETINRHPVIMIEFRDFNGPIMLEDIQIRYRDPNANFRPMTMKLGTNNYHNGKHNKTEIISVESFDKIDPYHGSGLMLFRKVFRIIHQTPILDKNMGGSILMVGYNRKNQNDSKLQKQSWKREFLNELSAGDFVQFAITSLENSPGIMYGNWKDGKPLIISMNKNSITTYHIQPEKYKFLTNSKKCQQVAYYGCIAKQLDKNEFNNCSKKCMPRVFSNLGINYSIPFCYSNDTEAEHCALNIGKNIVEQEMPSNCKKSCLNLRYYGGISAINPISKGYKGYNWYVFGYILTNNDYTLNSFDEYLIYDGIGLIGSVGGTLGMFIGFSLTGVISWFLAYLKKP